LDPQLDDSLLLTPPRVVWQPRAKFQDRLWLHLLLLLLTIVTTTWSGAYWYLGFLTEFKTPDLHVSLASMILHGFWYSGTILAILGCHEMGHYLACRYYDVDASLPYFLPVPLPLTGTLGAFIRIREQIPQKRMLFDIGIAGPIGGFLVALPALFIGIAMSHITQLPTGPFEAIEFGEPLLFRLASWTFWGTTPAGYTLNMHPVAFAAWFGLLATALNLFPVGQLDGGHISYAVLGRRSSHVTLLMLGLAVVLSVFASSLRVWTILMIAMLARFGRHHPPVFDEDVPLDRTRLFLALVAVVMFIVCATPDPIRLGAFLGR